MANLQSRTHISPDSDYPITLHPHFNPKITAHIPPEALREEVTPPKDRAYFADPEKKALFSVAKRVDLTESIGTLLEGVQISSLTEQQLDELALLVSERGVVFFREQDLDTQGQVRVFEHYGMLVLSRLELGSGLLMGLGILDKHPAQKVRFPGLMLYTRCKLVLTRS